MTDIFLKILLIVYCPDRSDRYKTQRMYDYPVILKLISGWFVTSKMLEKFDKVLLANDDTVFSNKDFNKVKFITNQRHILVVDLDKINLDNVKNFDEDDIIIHVRLLAWRSKYEKRKALKKISKELKLVPWQPKR